MNCVVAPFGGEDHGAEYAVEDEVENREYCLRSVRNKRVCDK